METTNNNPWIFCSCGNIVRVGRGPIKTNRETQEHPACGRKPNRIHIPSVMIPEAEMVSDNTK